MRKELHTVLCIAVVLSFIAAGGARAATEPVYAKNGMVAAAEPNATDAGVEILKAGGNAFDAAAAVAFALAVTYPNAGNIGGGGFCVALTADGKTWALDFRETAPAAATRDMFLDAQKNVIFGASLGTHLASGVPGAVDGYLRMAERGVLKRSQILAPAIRLAEKGFVVPVSLNRGLTKAEARLKHFASMAAAFYPNGRAVEFGEILRQLDLAQTLNSIAQEGRAGFYEGRVAKLIEAEMNRGGGIITGEDLKKYQSVERPAFVFNSGGYEIITHPLPSSGGVTLAQILGLSDLNELKQAGHQSAKYVHLLTEAERLAYADRNFYLGDPAFVKAPVERLVSQAYLAERRKLLPQEEKAGKSEGVAHGPAESRETTHFCVADRWGNVLAVTTTLNGPFGMGAVVEGAGFLLNNEMDDFSIKTGAMNASKLPGSEANAIEPGKRPLSSMTPTIVRKDGKFFMTIGSPGGSTIITTVLQVFLNVTQFGMNIRDAIEAGRVHHQWLPDEILCEQGAISPDTEVTLKKMGYTFRTIDSIGIACGIQRTPEGLLAGWADGRSEGKAAGY